MAAPSPDFAAIEARIDAIEAVVRAAAPAPADMAVELLALGEAVLEAWVTARGETPTHDLKEGFRLLALHRQGARGEPSFNACRETCRELVFHFNLIHPEPDHAETDKRLRLMIMVARHLHLFVSGKMQVAGLGEFCCSSRPVRSGPDAA